LIDRLEHKLATFQHERWVDQCRRDISRHCLAGAERPKGIFTLTVPTGGGKTLASLRFALHHAQRWSMDRVIYVSPYISIADQNAQVVREVLEPKECDFASIVLEHHSNLTEEKGRTGGLHDGGAGARSSIWRRNAVGAEAACARKRGNSLRRGADASGTLDTPFQQLCEFSGGAVRGKRRAVYGDAAFASSS
jgi:Rad3-related DNA helicase